MLRNRANQERSGPVVVGLGLLTDGAGELDEKSESREVLTVLVATVESKVSKGSYHAHWQRSTDQ